MRVLVGCEFSQIVCSSFRERGFEAYSCDVLPTEGKPEWHIQGDVLDILNDGWDLGIFHPECTYLTLAGARWFYDDRYPDRWQQQESAIGFFQKLQSAPIEKIAIENPQPFRRVMDKVGRYTQKIQPWQFGDAETKGICLWLKNLPPLEVSVAEKPAAVKARVWRMPPGPTRQRERSRFFPAVARAMAEQWGRKCQ